MFNNEDEFLAYYIEIGAVELTGMDETGEMIYQITDKAKEVAPDLWEAHTEHIDNTLKDLYMKGFVSIEYNENLEAIFQLTPEGVIAAKAAGLVEFQNENIPND